MDERLRANKFVHTRVKRYRLPPIIQLIQRADGRRVPADLLALQQDPLDLSHPSREALLYSEDQIAAPRRSLDLVLSQQVALVQFVINIEFYYAS